jgi:NAD(P)-dependent dehydrogenase (short-subunit alcohol dehydrogenase family)
MTTMPQYFGVDDAAVPQTGATGGIGRAMVEAFAAAAARLALTSNGADACNALATDCSRPGRRASAAPCARDGQDAGRRRWTRNLGRQLTAGRRSCNR